MVVYVLELFFFFFNLKILSFKFSTVTLWNKQYYKYLLFALDGFFSCHDEYFVNCTQLELALWHDISITELCSIIYFMLHNYLLLFFFDTLVAKMIPKVLLLLGPVFLIQWGYFVIYIISCNGVRGMCKCLL